MLCTNLNLRDLVALSDSSICVLKAYKVIFPTGNLHLYFFLQQT